MKKNALHKSKKRAAKKPPRNRFHRHSKLSEYKFLQVLEAFSEDKPAALAASETRISVKTVRTIYSGFRDRLIAATISDPYEFGGAGRFLLDGGKLGDRGRRFLAELARSETYAAHVRRHDFRLKKGERFTDELFECAVRAFCTLAMHGQPEDHYPPKTVEAILIFREIADWIAANRDQAGFLEQQASFLSRFDAIVEQMPRLLEKEDLLALRTHSKLHRFPENILLTGLRHYLLKDPL
ncbi:hypothetical protein [Hwanghaeella sp. LZ110]|uniref:hypothetical protein n=1 Tax=Hwanghaeella sp. LZ110 TaxID=3402810 RepID=UPI003B672E28